MPWGSPVLGTQITLRVGVLPSGLSTAGPRISLQTSPSLDQLLGAPNVKGLLQLDSKNTIVAVGTSPDFPIGPKWRKVVRQIG